MTRLGNSMQAMLADLARSRDDQQRLVQDAGHELRTPLTSLRTNVSVLRRFDELSIRSRQRLLDDVEGEYRELTDLVNELVETRHRPPRRRRNRTGRSRRTSLNELLPCSVDGPGGKSSSTSLRGGTSDGTEPDVVIGRPHSLERAVSNLVDNALKFDVNGYRSGRDPGGEGNSQFVRPRPGPGGRGWQAHLRSLLPVDRSPKPTGLRVSVCPLSRTW